MNTESKYIANKRVKHPYSWAKTTVYQILSNPVYLGKLVSQRYTTRSFKDKRIVECPPEEWVIVENTHEPLVDQATFDTVQERIKIKQPATWTNKVRIQDPHRQIEFWVIRYNLIRRLSLKNQRRDDHIFLMQFMSGHVYTGSGL